MYPTIGILKVMWIQRKIVRWTLWFKMTFLPRFGPSAPARQSPNCREYLCGVKTKTYYGQRMANG